MAHPINSLRLALLAEPTIVALVTDRVFVAEAPATALFPRVVLHQMGSDEHNDLAASGGSGDFRDIELDVECESDTASAAYNLAQAVRLFLRDYAGTTPAPDPITVLAMIIDDEHEKRAEKSTAPGGSKKFAVTVPLTLQYRP